MAIFMAGIIGGTGWGIVYTESVLHLFMATAVGGFTGSVAGTVCFAALYLFSSKEENGPDESAKEKALWLVGPDSERKLPGPEEKTRIREIEKELSRLKNKRNKKRGS